jgi:hypothetical protein
LLPSMATAQKDAGAIVGTVRDPSGAAVAGAKVIVTDVDRGVETNLSSNGDGEYVASPLKIGAYTVTVEKEGFKKAVAGPVQVNIQDRVAVDVKLQAGMVSETMTVTGERPQLETETSELGQVVDSTASTLSLSMGVTTLNSPCSVRAWRPLSRALAWRRPLASALEAPDRCKTISCSTASITTQTLATFLTEPHMWCSRR